LHLLAGLVFDIDFCRRLNEFPATEKVNQQTPRNNDIDWYANYFRFCPLVPSGAPMEIGKHSNGWNHGDQGDKTEISQIGGYGIMLNNPADKLKNCPADAKIDKNDLGKPAIKQITKKCWFSWLD